MKLTVCRNCANHVLKTESECPHCGTTQGEFRTKMGKGTAFSLLLGLMTFSACGEDEKTDSEPAEPESEDAPLYGAVDPE